VISDHFSVTPTKKKINLRAEEMGANSSREESPSWLQLCTNTSRKSQHRGSMIKENTTAEICEQQLCWCENPRPDHLSRKDRQQMQGRQSNEFNRDDWAKATGIDRKMAVRPEEGRNAPYRGKNQVVIAWTEKERQTLEEVNLNYPGNSSNDHNQRQVCTNKAVCLPLSEKCVAAGRIR
jgi:hypothetical protein